MVSTTHSKNKNRVVQNLLIVLTGVLQISSVILLAEYKDNNIGSITALTSIGLAFIILIGSYSWQELAKNILLTLSPIPFYFFILYSIVWILSIVTDGINLSTLVDLGYLFGIFGALFIAIALFIWPLVASAVGLSFIKVAVIKIKRSK